MVKLFKPLLQEKLIEIYESDINKIYQPIGGFINDFYRYGFTDRIRESIKEKSIVVLRTFRSGILDSPDCRFSNKNNPIKINIGIGTIPSYYNPEIKNIYIGIDKKVFWKIRNAYIDYDIPLRTPFNMDWFMGVSSIEDKLRYKNKLDKSSIKSTIYHELSHWVDDTKNNFHLLDFYRNRQKIEDLEKFFYKKFKTTEIDISFIEINAQMHAIYQMYREYKHMWDSMSIINLINRSSSLTIIFDNLYNEPELLEKWLRLLVTRMHREDLLGKNMRYLPYSINKDYYENCLTQPEEQYDLLLE